MKNKLFVVLVLISAITIGAIAIKQAPRNEKSTRVTSTSVQFINSTITATGSVVAQNQAKLNFQSGGKLVYLPFKEGDAVSAGQTVAQLDTYQLQRQLKAALNTYRSTRDSFDQTQQNSQDNALNTQVAPTYSKVNIENTTAINDAIKRIVDQNQANLDNSVVNVELANYALQLSTLTSPLTGIITHEDVTVTGVNITPVTTFTVADPDTVVFRANVPTTNIYYVTEGSTVDLAIDGLQEKIQGTVVKIFPTKITLASGQSVYLVDIASDGLNKQAKLDQGGTAIIHTNSENVALIPSWTVVNGNYVWIENNGKPELRKISAGKIHGNQIEITAGLSPTDNIITDPKYISELKYKIL